ncbi:hypothetical protein CRG98_033670 [Punica granatum]|uniref:Integrase catalytic domain-containing protein n=1 Tax=Punica granatum TaxID=22663 RepID=A0A2I0IPE1_PUNGR|nr:hypothetical protein CRG98_033670 [Punica granatum]
MEERPACGHCGKMGHSKSTYLALIGYLSWHSKSKTNAGKGTNEWILDTGAMRHMTECLENFSRTVPIKGEAPTSCVDTPQQNGRVERKHRHILNVARALMFQASLPTRLWGECVSTAIHLINITITPLLGNKSPHEVLFGKPPNYSNLRVYGSLRYAHTRTKDKFEPRSRKCAFIEYPHGKKGWRLYDLKYRQVFVSRDVWFCETIFPFATENEDSRQRRKRSLLFLDGIGSISPERWTEESQLDSRRLIHLGGTAEECFGWPEQLDPI